MTHNLPYKTEIKVLIFDFDGVIIDSMSVKVDEYKKLMSEFTNDEGKIDKIVQIYKNSIGIPRETTLKKVFKEVLSKNILTVEVDELSRKYSQRIFKRLESLKPLDGFLEYITLHQQLKKHIISGAPNSDLIYFMDKLGIRNKFDSVKGGPLKKSEEIASLIRLDKVKNNEVVYFGDQKNDFLAAEEARVQFIGINANKNLFKGKCPVFADFNELYGYEKNLGLLI